MPLYAATIALGAFLLFQVQPILAKAILPGFGGSAAVWTTCMLFFQAFLLLGYLYAHGVVRFLAPRAQAFLHVALLAASLAFLPVLPGFPAGAALEGSPALRILAALAAGVGVPYLLLSATSPLLQAWYARAHRAAFPYRLFALSNAGSMAALLTYPVAVEPFLPVRAQAWAWSAGYAAFCLLCGATAFARRRDGPGEETDPCGGAGEAPSAPVPEPRVRALWLLLPACASALLLGVTNHLTRNVAAVPFLWILPLSLYLLSFIVCFSGEGSYRRTFWTILLVPAIGAMGFFLSPSRETAGLAVTLPVYAGGCFVACMACHGEVALLKPGPRRLTEYYLLMALGGALGGVFVALLAPGLFRGYHELPVALAGCALLMAAVAFRERGEGGYLDAVVRDGGGRRGAAWLAASIALAVWFAAEVQAVETAARRMERNFYGVLRVVDTPAAAGFAGVRDLYHGAIIHGRQFLDPERHLEPTAYYSPDSGIGLAFRRHRAAEERRLGVIGLGAGMLVVFTGPRDALRFYEINPLVTRLAREEFAFLGNAPGPVAVVHGDARLVLAGERPNGFDVLAVDAFSGDAIPVHLLTREAFALYFRHLRPDGVLAVHVSNKYLDLRPVVAALARDAGKAAVLVETENDTARGYFGSAWVLVGEADGFLATPDVKGASKPLVPGRGRPWTDDYSHLVGALKR